MLDEKAPLASFENLRVEFDTKDGTVVAVEDISFEIKPKQTVCLVGESGSGKSVSSLSMTNDRIKSCFHSRKTIN